MEYIKLEDCVKGHLYKISSRNLSHGVYDGNEGFIGIREKFGRTYLFTEFHHDQGAPFGTVYPKDDLGPIPDNISVCEIFHTIDSHTERKVVWKETHKENNLALGIWCFADTGEHDKSISPICPQNQPLYDYLMKEHPVEAQPWVRNWRT